MKILSFSEILNLSHRLSPQTGLSAPVCLSLKQKPLMFLPNIRGSKQITFCPGASLLTIIPVGYYTPSIGDVDSDQYNNVLTNTHIFIWAT